MHFLLLLLFLGPVWSAGVDLESGFDFDERSPISPGRVLHYYGATEMMHLYSDAEARTVFLARRRPFRHPVVSGMSLEWMAVLEPLMKYFVRNDPTFIITTTQYSDVNVFLEDLQLTGWIHTTELHRILHLHPSFTFLNVLDEAMQASPPVPEDMLLVLLFLTVEFKSKMLLIDEGRGLLPSYDKSVTRLFKKLFTETNIYYNYFPLIERLNKWLGICRCHTFWMAVHHYAPSNCAVRLCALEMMYLLLTATLTMVLLRCATLFVGSNYPESVFLTSMWDWLPMVVVCCVVFYEKLGSLCACSKTEIIKNQA